MHEFPMTQNILKIACDTAEKEHLSRVKSIKVAYGPLSGIVPECIDLYFEMMREGTPATEAVISYRRLPLKVRCRDCGAENLLNEGEFACPVCGSDCLQKLGGGECYVESIEAE